MHCPIPQLHNTPFPDNVRCLTTPKYLTSGYGIGDYDNFNLAIHTGDDLLTVEKNRQLLQDTYQLPSTPKWLNQTHSDICLSADKITNLADADASWTRKKGVVCVVLTADCLPIFVSNTTGDFVGVIHAGYQGLLNGVVEAFIKKCPIQPQDLLVFLGAGIGQKTLGLDEKMFSQFTKKQESFATAFKQKQGQYFLSMPKLASQIFKQNGVANISTLSACTYSEPEKYFSYRRQGANSGRMANLIWLC